MRDVGSLAALWRYPVKSMGGESMDSAHLGQGGIAGDRRFALVDRATGLVASRKHPGKWGGLDGFTASGGGAGARVHIALPDGTCLASDEHGVDAPLSAALGRDVFLTDVPPADARVERLAPASEDDAGSVRSGRLARGASPDTFFDYAPLHLVTTSALAQLGADARRFRPNLVIDTGGAPGFVENDWVGRTLSVGDVELRVVTPSPRCVVPSLAHASDLPAQPELLRTIARANRVQVLDVGVRPCVGVYATISRPGTVRVRDMVRLAPP